MQCPVCTDVALAISSREGVEIDYCPQCRGVWLDRGELDKILDRVATAPSGSAAPGPPPRPAYDEPSYDRSYEERGYDRGYDDRRRDPRDMKRRKKRSFLDDIFDFD
jgi:Zn-finger nucleic acid-binding protein